MAAELVDWDASDFIKRSALAGATLIEAADAGVMLAAQQLLLASQAEVPFRKGHLMSTGKVHRKEQGWWQVSYSTPYAARLHEHPEYHFGHGRKGKYLEDPLKHNIVLFDKVVANTIKGVMK